MSYPGSEEPKLYPAVAYATQTFRAFSQAYEHHRAFYQLDIIALERPLGMPDAQFEQRKAIVQLVQKLVGMKMEKAMDEAVAHWKQYRTMRPAE